MSLLASLRSLSSPLLTKYLSPSPPSSSFVMRCVAILDAVDIPVDPTSAERSTFHHKGSIERAPVRVSRGVGEWEGREFRVQLKREE